MSPRTTITRADILPMDAFVAQRKEARARIVAIKRDRRISLGPHATFYFENYDTMWWQIQEMLYIEKGGEEQLADELAAYEPLVPKGAELVATFMIEVDDPARRARVLASLGHIDRHLYIECGNEKIYAVAEDDTERTREDGKTSAVHFLRFPFTVAQIAAFRAPSTRLLVGCDHDNYGHLAVMPETLRAALAQDFV